jgi:hypothetical protein
MDIYDELPDESERQYLEWADLAERAEVAIAIETDPVPGPEHPVGASEEATSEYSVLEMDATVLDGAGDIDEGEYRLAVSSSRLARALADVQAGAGDVVYVSWTEDGKYRRYEVRIDE